MVGKSNEAWCEPRELLETRRLVASADAFLNKLAGL